MRIHSIDYYFDGGTARIDTDTQSIFVDRRIDTDTPYALYSHYPAYGIKIINQCKAELIVALEYYLIANPTEKCTEELLKGLI